MKPIRVASIISGRPEDNGKRIKIALFKVGEVFRWYGGNVGESPAVCRDHDTELSEDSVAEACKLARGAWAGESWGLRAKWL